MFRESGCASDDEYYFVLCAITEVTFSLHGSTCTLQGRVQKSQGEGMTDKSIQEANDAFGKQVSSQIARITGELNRLEQVLSAGMVDRRVLTEFRDAVNKVRKTSWHVQCWLDGDLRDLSTMLTEERIRAVTQMANLLASELKNNEERADLSGLRDAIQKLDRVLQEQVVSTR
jgi:small-conductance mechanosensitive channel